MLLVRPGSGSSSACDTQEHAGGTSPRTHHVLQGKQELASMWAGEGKGAGEWGEQSHQTAWQTGRNGDFNVPVAKNKTQLPGTWCPSVFLRHASLTEASEPSWWCEAAWAITERSEGTEQPFLMFNRQIVLLLISGTSVSPLSKNLCAVYQHEFTLQIISWVEWA